MRQETQPLNRGHGNELATHGALPTARSIDTISGSTQASQQLIIDGSNC